MKKNIPPEHWSKRQAILILEQDQIDLLYETPDGKDILFNSECCILTLPLNKNNKIAQELIDHNLDKEGTVLIQNPFYKDRYEELSNIDQKFAMEKYFIFSTFCGYLGAKKVEVEEFENCKNTAIQKARIDSTVNVARLDNGLKKEIDDKFFKSLNVNLTFLGGEPDLEAASNLLKKTGLIAKSPEMHSLLEMRRSRVNQLKSSQVMLNLSEETNGILQFISSLNSLKYFVKFNYEQMIKEKKEYALKVSVTF